MDIDADDELSCNTIERNDDDEGLSSGDQKLDIIIEEPINFEVTQVPILTDEVRVQRSERRLHRTAPYSSNSHSLKQNDGSTMENSQMLNETKFQKGPIDVQKPSSVIQVSRKAYCKQSIPGISARETNIRNEKYRNTSKHLGIIESHVGISDYATTGLIYASTNSSSKLVSTVQLHAEDNSTQTISKDKCVCKYGTPFALEVPGPMIATKREISYVSNALTSDYETANHYSSSSTGVNLATNVLPILEQQMRQQLTVQKFGSAEDKPKSSSSNVVNGIQSNGNMGLNYTHVVHTHQQLHPSVCGDNIADVTARMALLMSKRFLLATTHSLVEITNCSNGLNSCQTTFSSGHNGYNSNHPSCGHVTGCNIPSTNGGISSARKGAEAFVMEYSWVSGGSETGNRQLCRKRKRAVSRLDRRQVLRCITCSRLEVRGYKYGDYVICKNCGNNDFIAVREWSPTRDGKFAGKYVTGDGPMGSYDTSSEDEGTGYI